MRTIEPSHPSAISRRSALFGGLAAGALGATTSWGQQTYPSRPVRVVIPFGAGGVTDVTARIVAEKLGDRLGQRFVIENQPGAGGIAAARTVLTAEPDGHVLGVAVNGTAISVSLMILPYDPVKDFAMVSTFGLFEAVFAVNAESPYKTLADFVQAAKDAPGKLNVGTVTVGGTQNLGAELFKTEAGVNFQIVPYRNSPEIVVALLRNDIQMAIEFYAAVQSPLLEKKIRPLATSGLKRASWLPDVPTVDEGGIKGFDVTSWNGLFVRAGTSGEVIKTLNQHIREVVALEDVRKRFGDLGIEAQASTPDELSARFRSDVDKWAKVIANAGIPKK